MRKERKNYSKIAGAQKPGGKIHVHALLRLVPRQLMLVLLFIYIFAGFHSTALASAHAVWAAEQGQTVAVYYAKSRGENWEKSIQISSGEGANITPSVTADKQDWAWLVWVERGGANYLLHTAMVTEGKVEALPSIPLPHSQNFAPVIVADEQGNLWVAWSSFDGLDEDIYCSCFNGKAWDAVKRVHTDNTVPDILPEIEIGTNGKPCISWFGFDGDHYVSYQVEYTEQGWSAQKKIADSVPGAARRMAEAESLPTTMPPDADNRLMGSIAIRENSLLRSFSDRGMENRVGK